MCNIYILRLSIESDNGALWVLEQQCVRTTMYQ